MWQLHKALYGYRNAPKTVEPTCCDSLGKTHLPPTPDRSELFRKLLFGPNIKILPLMKLLSSQVMMRIVERLARLGDQIFFLGRVIVRTARGHSVEANPKYIRDLIAVLGLEDSRPVSTPSVKRTPTTESLVKLENEKRAVYRTAVGKAVVHVPGAC